MERRTASEPGPSGDARGVIKPRVIRMRALLLILALLHVPGCQAPPPDPPRPATTVATHLMFQEGVAEEALSLYASVFPGFLITRVETYGPGQEGPEGTFKLAYVDFHGQRLMVYDSPVKHPFTFTPSVSLLVDFTTPEELGSAFARLADGGELLMPLADYGFSRRFGWCTDRFGVSWQLNLPHEGLATTALAE